LDIKRRRQSGKYVASLFLVLRQFLLQNLKDSFRVCGINHCLVWWKINSIRYRHFHSETSRNLTHLCNKVAFPPWLCWWTFFVCLVTMSSIYQQRFSWVCFYLFSNRNKLISKSLMRGPRARTLSKLMLHRPQETRIIPK
jgi:hypothetical protein